MIRRTMTVKRIDPWSVLKLGLVVSIAGAAILVLAGVIVWSVIRRLAIVERVCEQAKNILGLDSCVIQGSSILRTGLLSAALAVVVATGVMVFMTFLYNLIADLTGGVQVSVVDQSGDLQSARSSGGVEVAAQLQSSTGRSGPMSYGDDPRSRDVDDPSPTRASPAAMPSADTVRRPESSPTRERVVEVSKSAVRASERAVTRLKAAAQRTSDAVGNAGRQASVTLTEVTHPEAVSRARRTENATQSLDSVPERPRSSERPRASDETEAIFTGHPSATRSDGPAD